MLCCVIEVKKMKETLISKKDLLEKTEITYGQLYRWKRKNLIPEEWFIRKATFTGQETFFPEEKIVERIHKIKELKDSLSLDELASVFSPQTTEIKLKKHELLERNIVSSSSISIYEEQLGAIDTITFHTALYLFLIHKCLETGEIGWEEGKEVIQTLHVHYPKLDQKRGFLVVLRKMGIVTVLLISDANHYYVDEKTKIAVLLNVEDAADVLVNQLVTGGF
jgi:hypothetical protein